jgi:hypothetical protein
MIPRLFSPAAWRDWAWCTALIFLVGARLAREGVMSANINVEWYDALAGKPCSYRVGV